MIYYARTLPSGRIIEAGTCQDEVFDLVPQEAGTEIITLPAPADPEVNYWKGELKSYPPKADSRLVFDFDLEQWVEDEDPASISQAKESAVFEVNQIAGRQRKLFITDTAGQQAIYMRKEAEASRYLSLDPEPADLSAFPMMAAEVGLTAPTAYQLAQVWLYMAQTWEVAASAIEAVRLTAINAVETAPTIADIEIAIEQARTNITAIIP